MDVTFGIRAGRTLGDLRVMGLIVCALDCMFAKCFSNFVCA